MPFSSFRSRVTIAAAAVASAAIASGCGPTGRATEVPTGATAPAASASPSTEQAAAPPGSTPTTRRRSTTTDPTDTTSADSGSGSATPATAGCPAEDGSSPRTTRFTKAPPMCIDAAKSYTATMVTTEGELVIALDAATAPVTVNNFVVLSRFHYYDGIVFHRAIPGFMAQGGDPQGTGTGGPGYDFADELPTDATPYTRGTVAMANRGADTNGSQFFVMADDNPDLPANYAVFGHVTEGLDTTLDAIMDGPSAGEPPDDPARIISVTITAA